MATVNELIQETKNRLGSHREWITTLNTEMSASTTTLDATVTLPNKPNEVEVVGTNGAELMAVSLWGSGNYTVVRAQEGTTAVVHPAGSVVRPNPRYPVYQIKRALTQELRSLAASGLFRVTTASLTYNTLQQGFDLSSLTDLTSIVSLKVTHAGRESTLTGDNLHTEGNWLKYGYGSPNSTVLTYRRDFGSLPAGDSTDIEASTGLPLAAHDILPLGAAYRLLMGKEALRADIESQPVARDFEEVSQQSISRIALQYRAERDMRIAEEVMKLRGKYRARF